MSKLSMLTSFWRKKDDYESIFTKEKIMAFMRMLPLILTGSYKPKKKRNLIFGVAAIIYLISPIDIIPEIVFGPIGLIDDFAILFFAIKRIEKEVINFISWEAIKRSVIYID